MDLKLRFFNLVPKFTVPPYKTHNGGIIRFSLRYAFSEQRAAKSRGWASFWKKQNWEISIIRDFRLLLVQISDEVGIFGIP